MVIRSIRSPSGFTFATPCFPQARVAGCGHDPWPLKGYEGCSMFCTVLHRWYKMMSAAAGHHCVQHKVPRIMVEHDVQPTLETVVI